MHTFSQMVDEMVSETRRPDLVSEIARYLNQTIRELHFSEDRGAVIFYSENFKEAIITSAVEQGLTWEIPEPTTFQKLQGVKFNNTYDDDGQPVWASERVPSRALRDYTNFYYRVGNTFVFSGFGGLNATVGLGWYEFPRSLKYKAADVRPASYDIESGWTYLDSMWDDEEKLGAQALSTNWLLMRWSDIIAEGLRAKVYKRLSDDSRSRTCYSLYQSLRHGLWTSETAEFYGG